MICCPLLGVGGAGGGCAEASERQRRRTASAAHTARTHCTGKRRRFIALTPRSTRLAEPAAADVGRVRHALPRRIHRGGRPAPGCGGSGQAALALAAAADERFRFLRDLRHVQCQILLLAVAHHRDVCLTGGTDRAKDLLAARRIIQRRAVDGRHQVARAQAQPRERLAVAARVDAVAASACPARTPAAAA